MDERPAAKRHVMASTWVVSGLTMVSRVLGLVRDTVMAFFFGASGTAAMSAFAVAFKIPNLFRRLLGEGALSAAFIPVLSEHLEADDHDGARRLVQVVVTAQVVLMAALVAIGELILIVWLSLAAEPQLQLVLQLAAIMLPFLLTACLLAMLMAILNAHRHFAMPAASPVILNVVIIAMVAAAGPLFGDAPQERIFSAALAVLAAGLIQIGLHLPVLARRGVRLRWAWDLAHPGLRRVARNWLPVVFGLGVMQLNVLADSLLAWNLDDPGDGSRLFGAFAWPMAGGAPGVLYYAQRLYHLPMGVFAIALATVIFVEFSRHAARDDRRALAGSLSRGLRLALFICVPAAAGLMVLGEPTVRLILERGSFKDFDTARVSWALLFYAAGIPGFALQILLVRAFYALGDTRTPVRTGVWMVALNLPLNVVLIFLMHHEAGLAAATSVCSALQVAWLVRRLRRRLGPFNGRRVAVSAAKTLLAAGAMSAACWAALAGVQHLWPLSAKTPLFVKLAHVGLPLVVAVSVYAAAAFALRMPELQEVLQRRRPPAD
jgi:putative peptidoglycan lipid II flippase